MAKQTFTTGQVLTAAQVNSLQTNDFNQTVSAKTASYVLVAADKGTRIEFSTSGSVTCTVNTGLFDAGDTVYIQNTGAGVVTITAGTATVNTSATLAVNQYEGGVLYFVSASSAIWFEYASAATGDITGITTGATSGLTGGVTSGTADLKLNTAAKGDLLVGTGAGTVSALTVGANGTTLVADSAQTTGLKWAAPAGGGKVLQVVEVEYATATTIASSSPTDTGLSGSITPSSASSKVLVIVTQQYRLLRQINQQIAGYFKLFRGATEIITGNEYLELSTGTDSGGYIAWKGSFATTELDSPNTTSSVTYKTQLYVQTTSNSGQIVAQPSNTVSKLILMEIGA